MKKEQNNFARVIEWLIANGKIENQKDLAEIIGSTPTTISRIKIGFVRRPDEDTLRKFNAKFGDTINIAYLRGESDVMLVADLQENNNGVNSSVTSLPLPDYITQLLAAKDETIAGKDETIAALRQQLADKDNVIAAKDALITHLQQQLSVHNLQTAIEKGRSVGQPKAAADHKLF